MIPASTSFQEDCGKLFEVFLMYDLLCNMGTSDLDFGCAEEFFFFEGGGGCGAGVCVCAWRDCTLAMEVMSNSTSLQLAFCVQ